MIQPVHNSFWQHSMIGLLLLSVGCSQPQPSQSEDILSFQVEPSGRPGTYVVTGNANLPDESRVTVSAVRVLKPAYQRSTYAVLDRQVTAVEEGQWQATLNLWKVAPDGAYREAWQLNQAELSSLNADAEVTFMSTVDLPSQSSDLQSELRNRLESVQGNLLQFTQEGQQYLQASSAQAIALPSGQTTPPPSRPEDENGGWGDRSTLPPDSSNVPNRLSPATSEQITAPLSRQERLQ